MYTFTKYSSFYAKIVCTLSINGSFLWFGSPIIIKAKMELQLRNINTERVRIEIKIWNLMFIKV